MLTMNKDFFCQICNMSFYKLPSVTQPKKSKQMASHANKAQLFHVRICGLFLNCIKYTTCCTCSTLLISTIQWTIIGWGFCDVQNNQGRRGGCRDFDYSGYQKKNKSYCFIIHWMKEKWKSHFWFFTHSKQHKVCDLDMITHRNHELWSHMTHALEFSVHDYCIICS